jgi:hypothetical protein
MVTAREGAEMARIVMTSIEKLIRACVDDERALRRSGRFLGAGPRGKLERLACERERFVDELQTVGTTLNGRPRATGSWLGFARGLAERGWAFAAGPNSGDAIAVCRHSQQRTELLFADALESSWTTGVRAALVDQHQRIARARDVLTGMQYPASAYSASA